MAGTRHEVESSDRRPGVEEFLGNLVPAEYTYLKKKNFYFVLGYSQLTHNAVIVLGEQRKDSAMHRHVSILPQTPFPSGCLGH